MALERRLRLLLAWPLMLLLCVAVRAEPVDIDALRVERGVEGVLLSAQMRFELPPGVNEALHKGIPMVFVSEAVLLRDRWYWYDKEVAGASRQMRLAYQPLTRRWRLLVSNAPIGASGLALGQNFDTLDEALAAVQRISGWKIAELGDVDPERRYSVTLRFRLDVSQLPRPFQIGVVGHSDWNLSVERTMKLSAEHLR
jgi:hypothetical protein